MSTMEIGKIALGSVVDNDAIMRLINELQCRVHELELAVFDDDTEPTIDPLEETHQRFVSRIRANEGSE
jgi:hypothetical protein